jgi:hypothetical protein
MIRVILEHDPMLPDLNINIYTKRFPKTRLVITKKKNSTFLPIIQLEQSLRNMYRPSGRPTHLYVPHHHGPVLQTPGIQRGFIYFSLRGAYIQRPVRVYSMAS